MSTPASSENLVPVINLDGRIWMLRGERVMFDRDLAQLYMVTTKALNQAVSRNRERFPADFMFQLTRDEAAKLRQQLVEAPQTGVPARRNIQALPYAFTEQGIAMLSGVLKSERAVAVNIEIMRAFVRLRQLIATSADLSRKLRGLEKKYDAQFKVVFDAIRELMSPDPVAPNREIGFHTQLKPPPVKKR